MSVARRREKIDPKHKRLSVVRQCALLQISRSGHYYRPRGESGDALALMRLIDEVFLESPYYGARQMMRHLHRLGHRIGRHRVARLMRTMGLRAIYQKPNTSAPHPEHRIYPYLLRDLAVVRPNQVWCVNKRPNGTPANLARSTAYRADRRRDPAPIDSGWHILTRLQ